MTQRQLNRTLLARQMLLKREAVPVNTVVERLVGLQAQIPRPPFVGLWTRLENFRRDQLLHALQTKTLVRGTMMRATLHLMSKGDYLRFRQTLQPMLTSAMQSIVKQRMGDADLTQSIRQAQKLFRQQPRTFEALREALTEQFPDLEERSMGYAARMSLPLAMMPDDAAEFGFSNDAPFFDAEKWLGAKVDPASHAAELVERYLQAFGPATVADAQSWCGMRGLKEVFEKLRPQLKSIKVGKRELFDIPDGIIANEDTPAPVRFLPWYDNAILGHADRSRIVPEHHKQHLASNNLQVPATFLVDGFVAGRWDISVKKKSATVTLKAFEKLNKKVMADLEAEALRLGAFLAEGAAVEVRFESV